LEQPMVDRASFELATALLCRVTAYTTGPPRRTAFTWEDSMPVPKVTSVEKQSQRGGQSEVCV